MLRSAFTLARNPWATFFEQNCLFLTICTNGTGQEMNHQKPLKPHDFSLALGCTFVSLWTWAWHCGHSYENMTSKELQACPGSLHLPGPLFLAQSVN